MQNRTSIHLNSDSVQIETIRNGQRSLKNTNIQAVQEVLTRGERIKTPLLPFGWGVQSYEKVNNREQFVLATPETRHKAKYDNRGDGGGIQDFDIIAPAGVWLIHTEHDPVSDQRRYIHGVVFAVKQQILGLNDQLYHYPFSNCTETYICWGGSSDAPVLGGSKSIQTIPDRFFANPFNSDLDSRRYESFRDEVNGRTITRERCIHLLQYLDKTVKEADEKGEQPKFKNDILRPYARLGEVMESFSRQHLRG